MATSSEVLFGVSEKILARNRRRRRLKDQIAARTISLGGISVIGAVSLIFFYLLYEVMPLFVPASIEQRAVLNQFSLSGALHVEVEEQSRVGLAIDGQRGPLFFDARTGVALADPAPLTFAAPITAFAKDAPSTRAFALGFADGSVQLFKHDYHVALEGKDKIVTPRLKAASDEPIPVLPGKAIRQLAFRESDDGIKLIVLDDDGRLYLKEFEKVTSFLSDEVELSELDTRELPTPSGNVNQILLSLDQRWLFLVEDQHKIETYDMRKPAAKMRLSLLDAVAQDVNITRVEFLLGGFSLLVGDDQGHISQWFMARDEKGNDYLAQVRTLTLEPGVAITTLQAEHRRKGFIAGDAQGNIGIYNTTAEREVMTESIGAAPVEWIAMTPRADMVAFKLRDAVPVSYSVHNEHPEVSLSSLWKEVWYERYQEPDYVWQSSSANNDNEPKFSLMPLTFGTLKAAFYAMLVAVPLAICGAIFAAYFMAPGLRTYVKPTIELMEALPTVILGFLAGLWLAPLMEANLAGVTAILVLTPTLILLTAIGWSRLPLNIRLLVPTGWVPVLLVPVVVFSGAVSMSLSEPLELWLFNGDMRHWLTHDMGIDFDQRNSMVVGLAMGFAVIPTIFSIAEDAIFAVPKSLTQGSLALGATPWQTLVRVVLPTASPGIFSALMMGLGRAVGETMIVLMATGNTPIMDMNIFEGLRTLSANIAVEMPEAEVDSSHFRILFLSGLVLFIFTFIVNTTAESVRQRLRAKYGSL